MAMQDSGFKTQLFRFIDVLPSITDDEEVVALAREYLGDGGLPLFGGQWGLNILSATSLGARLSGKAIRSQVEHMARTFIAGATVEEAAPPLSDLWQHGRAWSVDLLGEATISDREADRYRDRCVEALSFPSRSRPSLLISTQSIRKAATVRSRRGFDPSSIWRCAFRLR
jgi:RHH-type proline utilization regulon transcriptional repressor/proline dehydrogenase/delta 1-pyrroline-5-carboxylate dehydrogenase